MRPLTPIACTRCKHLYRGKRPGWGICCRAFPDGIPEAILFGQPHTSPVDGDNGILFESLPSSAKADVSPDMTATGDDLLTRAVAALHTFAANAGATDGSACVLPPGTITAQADAAEAEKTKLNGLWNSGKADGFAGLTVKQLQTLAKGHGVPVARTKADFLKLLDAAEPYIDHAGLSGQALMAKLKQFNIANLRSKDELVAYLTEKQAAEFAAKVVKEAVQNAAPLPVDLDSMLHTELIKLAKSKGVTPYLTQDDVIAFLNKVEPGIDHLGLSPAELVAAKAKYKLTGPLKPKAMLIEALQKAAGQELAQEVVQQQVSSAVLAMQQTLEQKAGAVLLPPSPHGWKDFQASVKAAEQALADAQAGGVSGDVLSAQAAAIAIKKAAFKAQIDGMSSGAIKDLAKQTGLPHWNFCSKPELLTLMTETDPILYQAAKDAVDTKWLTWKFKHGVITGDEASPEIIAAAKKLAGADEAAAAVAAQAAAEAEAAAAAQVMAKAQEVAAQAQASLLVPDDPAEYKAFLDSLSFMDTVYKTHPSLTGYPDIVAGIDANAAMQVAAFKAKLDVMPVAELKKLLKAETTHWPYLTKEQAITLMTDTNPATKQGIIDALQAKVDGYEAAKKAKAAAAAQAKKAAKQQAADVVPPVVDIPEPVPASVAELHNPPPAADIPAKQITSADYAHVDNAWGQIAANPSAFFRSGQTANLGGVHRKMTYTDPDGNRWLFKPMREDFLADADEMTYKITRLFDPEAVEVRKIVLNGQTGSIQRMRSDLAAKIDYMGDDVTKIADEEVAQILQHHVVDWLISNHDAHSENFLRTVSGKVIPIDRAQAFKYFGNDALDINYNPNAYYVHPATLYNDIYTATKSGRMSIDPRHTLQAIRRVEAISDEEFMAQIIPYANARPGTAASRREFIQAVLDRKRNIRKDFEGLYAKVLNNPRFTFASLEETAEEAVATAVKKVLPDDLQDAVLNTVRDRESWQGVTLPFDTDMVEDNNLLIYSERVRRSAMDTDNYDLRSVFRMKLRPETQKRFLEAISDVMRDVTPTRPRFPKPGDMVEEDSFYGRLLEGVKTIVHHLKNGDRDFNMGRIQQALSCKPELEALLRHERIELRDMAEHYLDMIRNIERIVNDGDSMPLPKLAQFVVKAGRFTPEPTIDVPVSTRGFTAVKKNLTVDKREIKNGVISVTEQDLHAGKLFRYDEMPKGVQYEVNFDDGTKIRYRPFTSQRAVSKSDSERNAYAHSGDFEMFVPGNLTPDKIESTFEKMRQVGIPADVAPPEYQEYLYLHKVAYMNNYHIESGYRQMMQQWEAHGTPVAERVTGLQQYWGRKLGVDDVRRLPNYDPFGTYQYDTQRRTAGTIGYRVTKRFDIDVEKEMEGYNLMHQMHNEPAQSYIDLIDLMLEHNGSFVSTVEKLRVGVPVGGMSPEADMLSGGASYIFMRWRANPMSPQSLRSEMGFFFKPSVAARTDTISFSHDLFGECHDAYVQDNRVVSPLDWKRQAEGNRSNETIVKYNITLLDNIDVIVLDSADAKKRMVDTFKKHGIDKLPDGRKVDDIVKVKRGARSSYG